MTSAINPSHGEAHRAAAMAAAQGGDARAYRILLRGCVPVIAATARAQGVPASAVDDVVQETLLTLHRARATYDPARPFLPLRRALARRRSIDHLRRSARRAPEVHVPTASEHVADPAPLPCEQLARGDRRADLVPAIEALPGAQRFAVEQLVVRELSLAEAAAGTGRSKVSLKVNLHRALMTLRRLLSDGGDGEAPRRVSGDDAADRPHGRPTAADPRPSASRSCAPARSGRGIRVIAPSGPRSLRGEAL